MIKSFRTYLKEAKDKKYTIHYTHHKKHKKHEVTAHSPVHAFGLFGAYWAGNHNDSCNVTSCHSSDSCTADNSSCSAGGPSGTVSGGASAGSAGGAPGA